MATFSGEENEKIRKVMATFSGEDNEKTRKKLWPRSAVRTMRRHVKSYGYRSAVKTMRRYVKSYGHVQR